MEKKKTGKNEQKLYISSYHARALLVGNFNAQLSTTGARYPDLVHLVPLSVMCWIESVASFAPYVEIVEHLGKCKYIDRYPMSQAMSTWNGHHPLRMSLGASRRLWYGRCPRTVYGESLAIGFDQ